MRCYLVSQICGVDSEQHSKPVLFFVKGKPDLGMWSLMWLRECVLVHTNTLTLISLVSCQDVLVDDHSDSPTRGAPEVHPSSPPSALLLPARSFSLPPRADFQPVPFLPWTLTWNLPENWENRQRTFFSGFFDLWTDIWFLLDPCSFRETYFLLLFSMPALADLWFIQFVRWPFIRRCEKHKNRQVIWVPICSELQQNSRNNHPTCIRGHWAPTGCKSSVFSWGKRPVGSKQLCNSIRKVDYYVFIAVYAF